jgi:hypothetical protein
LGTSPGTSRRSKRNADDPVSSSKRQIAWAETKEGAAEEFCAKGNPLSDIWRIIAGPLGYLRDNVAG